MVTPGMPGPLTGPPTWGMYPVTMGQTCMLPMVATGFPAIAVWFIALDFYCLLHYIYFKGGTFYAGHGAAHIGLHAAFHIYILFAFHGSVHAVDGHILLGFDVYGTFGSYAGVAVALQGHVAFGYSRDVGFGSQFNILLGPEGDVFFGIQADVLGAEGNVLDRGKEQRLLLRVEGDDGAAVVADVDFLGPVGVVELDGVTAAGGDGFDIVVGHHAAGVVHVEEAAGHKGPGGIALLEGDHDLVADFGNEPKAAVLFDDCAGTGSGRLYPHPIGGGILVLPEETHLHAAQLIGVGIVGDGCRLREGHRGLEAVGQRQGFGGTGHALKLIAIKAFLIHYVGDGQYPVAAEIGSAIFLEGLGQTGGYELTHADGAGVAYGFKYGTLRVHSAEMGTGSGHDVRLVDHRSSGRQFGGFFVEVRRTVLSHTHVAVHPVDAFWGGIFLIIVGIGVVVVQLRIQLLQSRRNIQRLQLHIKSRTRSILTLRIAQHQLLTVVVKPLPAKRRHARQKLPRSLPILHRIRQNPLKNRLTLQLHLHPRALQLLTHQVAQRIIHVSPHRGSAVQQQGGTAPKKACEALIAIAAPTLNIRHHTRKLRQLTRHQVLHLNIHSHPQLLKHRLRRSAPKARLIGFVVH